MARDSRSGAHGNELRSGVTVTFGFRGWFLHASLVIDQTVGVLPGIVASANIARIPGNEFQMPGKKYVLGCIMGNPVKTSPLVTISILIASQ